MKVCELIAYAREVRPESPSHAFSDETVLVWVNEIEGMVQSEIFLTSPADLITYTKDDLEAELLVPAPHSKIYRAYVCSMIDFARGEYSTYSNTYELFNEWWNEYAAWYALMYDPASGKGEIKGYYVSAYAIAVKHGYKGTEEEWLSELDLRVKDAEKHASDSAASAAAAMIAVTKYPMIGEDGYWYVWDTVLGEYKKTSAKGEGAPGDPGKSAYEYAKEAGYPDSEEQFAEDLANAGNGGGGSDVELSDSSPDMNGTASPGTSEEVSRADHVHPTDTSRMPSVSNLASYVMVPTTGGVIMYDGVTVFKVSWDTFLSHLKSKLNYASSADLTKKVNVSDIINNLSTNAKDKPLSAAQGVTLKALIDDITVPTALSQLNNDAGYLKGTELDSAVDDALAEAKASGEFDGATGRRGTGILNTTTGIAAYTTTTNGIKPNYRILLSTLKAQAKVDEVLVGDIVRYSTFLYPVITLDTDYAYLGTRTSIQGTSISISSITESDESEGENVVTFSDKKTLTIKNGKDGANGYTPIRGTDYWTPTDKQEIKNDIISSIVTQEAGESESLVMSQKAVTDLVAEAVGTGGGASTEYETVDSVDEMTDTTKQYVLKETGTIWAYGEFTEEVNVNDQIFDASRVNKWHMSGTATLVTNNSYNLYLMPTDVSQIPEGTDIYVEIEGLYARNTTSPYIEKIGYSPLENPALGTDVLLKCAYADSTNMGNSLVNTGKGCKLHLGYYKEEKITNWDDIKTLLIEVPTAQTHDASTIKAYLQYSYTGTVVKWYDTNLAPSSGGSGGGNYVELLVKVNKNTTDIAEVSNRVTAIEAGSDSLTVPSFWQDAVDACISKIKALQLGRNCVTFPFFSDNHQNTKYAGVLIAHIMKECNIPYAFFGGDSISNGIIADEATMIAQDKAFDTMMSYVTNGRFCRAVGNHDGFWNDGTNKYYYNRDQVYDLFLREESIAQNKHFGEDGTYYYVDDIASKVRWIVMNTNNAPVDSTQIAWVQNTALNITESGWGVVFISHQPISNHYHAGITNAADVVSAVTSTASSKSIPIIGWFSGHVHRDIISTKRLTGGNGSNAGTEAGDLGFTQVIITSDHTGIAYDDATKHTIANDDQSHAIDFVTINKSTRTVNITRLGIGNDRSYTY